MKFIEAEERVIRAFINAGIDGFIRQHRVNIEPRGYYAMDFYFPALKLNIEIDSPDHFRTAKQRAEDRRDTCLRSVLPGIVILRFQNATPPEDIVRSVLAIKGEVS